MGGSVLKMPHNVTIVDKTFDLVDNFEILTQPENCHKCSWTDGLDTIFEY